MTDFQGNHLDIGDTVVFAYNKHKTTKLKNGVVIDTDVKQVNMLMAVIEMKEGTCRVSSQNIFKTEKG